MIPSGSDYVIKVWAGNFGIMAIEPADHCDLYFRLAASKDGH
jgi:hypothetical protein